MDIEKPVIAIMSFSDAYAVIKKNKHLCMISDTRLIAMRYVESRQYFLFAHPTERAWFQYVPTIDDFDANDWRIIGFPVGWKNSDDLTIAGQGTGRG